jgi:DNA-binding transcriptional MerR regulator
MTISDVSKEFELSIETLRYYERIGLIPPVTRNRGGIRDYNETDCGWVAFIKCMRSAGIPVESLIEYVSLYQQGNTTHEARKEILRSQRVILKDNLEKLQTALEKLDYKIANYDSLLTGNVKSPDCT